MKVWRIVLPAIVGLVCPFVAYAQTATLPLYRLVHGMDHFYTTDCSEKNSAIQNYGYTFEFVQAYIFPSASAQIVPLYRLRNGSWHFYTADPNEEQQLLNSNSGWILEGIPGYVANAALPNLTPLYRSSWPGGGHYYTTNLQEWSQEIAAGWKGEGITGWVLNRTDNPCPNPVPPPAGQTDIQKAYQNELWAWNDNGPCSQFLLCATYFDSWGVNLTFSDGSVAPFAHVQRLTTSAHDCIQNAKNALPGQKGLAVEWVMASQIHNPDLLNWMKNHPDAVIAALSQIQ